MIKLDLKEMVDKNGNIRRLNFPTSRQYKEDLRKNIENLAALAKYELTPRMVLLHVDGCENAFGNL